MITIKLDNTNIYSAINVKVNKSSKLLDKIVENKATVEIDNTLQDFTYDVSEKKLKFNGVNIIDKEMVITIDNKKQFTGLVEKYEYDIGKQTVKIICKDKWKKSRDTKAEEKYYFEKSFDFILKDLLGQIGITDFSNIYEITDTIQYFYTNGEVEVADEIEKLMTAVGGYIYFDEDGIISFDGGFYPYKSAPIDTTTKATFYPDEYANLNLKNPSETGKIRVEAKTFKKKDELVPIYTQKDMQIPTNPYPESPEELFAEFDNPVFYVQSLNDISFYSSTGVSLDSAVYNDNFVSGNMPKNPKKFKLSFLGGGTSEIVDRLVIKGKIFEEETYISERGSGKQKEFKTEIAQNKEWVNFLTNWYYDNIVAQNSELTLELSDFRQLTANDGLKLKDKIVIVNPENGIQNRYVIDEMDINYESSKIKLTLRIDLDSYVDVALPKKLQVPTLPQLDLDLEEIKKLFQNTAPAVPSWGTNVLSTLFYNGKSYVTAEWDANTEEYFKNYEIYRSYDNINFDFMGATNITKFSFEVPPKTNVYIKLKSVSYDDLKSDFSSVKSITSAYGESVEDDPVAITSYVGFGYIWLKWSKSNDDNYAGTVIQRQTNGGSYVGIATILDNTYMDTNIIGGNTYKYRIYFVNKFGINGTAIYSSTITAKDKIEKVDINNFVVENTDFASGIQPIQVVDTLPVLPDTSYPNNSVVILTTDSKLYRNKNGSWTKEIDKVDITNFEVTFSDLESGLLPTRSVSTLPTLPNSNYPIGSIVYLTTDGKIYRNDNGTWKKNVDTTDLNGQITNAQIATNAIQAPQINAGAVTEAKIATSAITETKISDNAVTAPKIIAGAIQAGHITSGAVTADKLAADSVDANKIAAGSIDATHINVNKINAGDIIAAGTISASEIATNAITSIKINANAITTAKIAAGAVTATEIATGTITATQIASNAITADKISANAVTAIKIAAGAITSDKIAANTITAGNIASGAISTDELAAGAITADKIGVEAVTADKIATNAITASKIAAESISADKLSSLELTGTKYIQAGDVNQGYRIDATNGLIRLLDTQQYPIPSIMHQGEANLGTSTEKTITLSPSMTDTNYEVILNMKSYKYWDSGMDINQPRYMNLYVKDKTLTSFKIVAETLYAQALISLNNDYNILTEINSGNFHNKYSVGNMIGYTTEFLGIQKTNSISNYTGYISSRIDYDLEQNDYSNLGKKTFTLKTNPGDFWTTKTYTAGSYETNPDTDPPDGNYGIVNIQTLSYGENDLGHQLEFGWSGIYFVGSLRAGHPSQFPPPSTQPSCTYNYPQSDLIDMFQTCVYMNENYGGGKIKFIYDFRNPYVYVIYKFYTPSGSLIFTKKYGTYGHIAFVSGGGYVYFRLYVYFKTDLSLPSSLKFTLKSTEHPEATTSANAIVNYTVIGK